MSGDKIEKLERLSSLFKEGLLTQEEFEAQKKEILSEDVIGSTQGGNEERRTRAADNAASPALEPRSFDIEEETPSFDMQRVKCPLGYASIVLVAAMFLPWAGSGGISVSGWEATKLAKFATGFAYLIYVIPAAASYMLLLIAQGRQVPGVIKFSGWIPLLLVVISFFSVRSKFGASIELGAFIEFTTNMFSFGFFVSLIMGFCLPFISHMGEVDFLDDY